MLQEINRLENEKKNYQSFKSQIEYLANSISTVNTKLDSVVADINLNYNIDEMSGDRNIVLKQKDNIESVVVFLTSSVLPLINDKINNISNTISVKQQQYNEYKRQQQEEARKKAEEEARRIAEIDSNAA